MLVLAFTLGGVVVAGGVVLGAWIAWRLAQHENPVQLPARSKLFECFAHTDESEALLEEQR